MQRIESFELAELLRRLDCLEGALKPDDSVTVRDVVELTGKSLHEVEEALAKLREEDHRARLATVLRELEAPLYSVERPGFVKDNLADWARMQTIRKAFPDR